MLLAITNLIARTTTLQMKEFAIRINTPGVEGVTAQPISLPVWAEVFTAQTVAEHRVQHDHIPNEKTARAAV